MKEDGLAPYSKKGQMSALKMQQEPWTRHHKSGVEDSPGVVVVSMGTNDGSKIFDDSLTSLNWLHNLNIMGELHTSTPPTPPASPGPLNASGVLDTFCGNGVLNVSSTEGLMGPPTLSGPYLNSLVSSVNQSTTTSSSSSSFTSSSNANRKNRSCTYQQPADNVDYKTNGDVKPPYSYATLICMAMKSNKNKMSLSAIYKWIKDNFMYYRRADTGWQNSIRHNLSLNKCFIKVARNKDEPGKGGFWRLDPKYAEEMADGTFKKRRMSSNRPSPPKKTIGVVHKKDNNNCSSYFRQSQSLSQTSQQPPTHSSMPLETSLLPLLSVHPIPNSSMNEVVSGGLQNGNDNMISAEDEAEGEAAAAALKGDFCWNSVLNEDIEVEGLRYKTLDIVDMDGVTTDMNTYQNQHRTTALSHLHASVSSSTSSPSVPLVSHSYDGIGCLDSPALSLDDDDLLASDTSNDLSDTLDLTVHGTHVTTPDWWSRLTTSDGSASNMVNAIDLTTSSILGHLGGVGGSDYDTSSTNSTGNFLSHVWDDATRPVLDGQLDLDGLVDLYVY